MLVIMAEKVEKGFMTTIRSFCTVLICAISVMVIFAGCGPEPTDDAIPFAPFPPMVIQLNNPEYQNLNIKGYVEISGIGVKGVILHRVNASTYHAYERNCSFEPNSACALVQVDPSGLFMIDNCCGSRFDMGTGAPSGGPAWRELRQYVTTLNGTQLTITDEVLN